MTTLSTLDENIPLNSTIVGLRPTTAISADIPRNLWVVTCGFSYCYSGGAFASVSFISEDGTLEFLNFMSRCISEYRDSGRGGSDEYDHIDGWNKWVGTKPHQLDWPNDPATDDSYSATIETVTIRYYDGAGQPFNVVIETADEA